jgi:hypothetical protein
VSVNSAEQLDDLQPPSSGAGPLIQRDYWAVIDGCRYKPSEVIRIVAARFPEFPPGEVVVFERDADGGPAGTLERGDELDIRIRLAGHARVRVVHTAPCSLTLATLTGHPEAGRITFGAYRNTDGDVVFHIRSRASSGSLFHRLGFLIGGDPMQTMTWTDFVNNVAVTCGNGVAGDVNVESRPLGTDDLEPGDTAMDCPTFVAEGD